MHFFNISKYRHFNVINNISNSNYIHLDFSSFINHTNKSYKQRSFLNTLIVSK